MGGALPCVHSQCTWTCRGLPRAMQGLTSLHVNPPWALAQTPPSGRTQGSAGERWRPGMLVTGQLGLSWSTEGWGS